MWLCFGHDHGKPKNFSQCGAYAAPLIVDIPPKPLLLPHFFSVFHRPGQRRPT
jgi:hypothetical protein